VWCVSHLSLCSRFGSCFCGVGGFSLDEGGALKVSSARLLPSAEFAVHPLAQRQFQKAIAVF
jgi:hypothetical protein